MNKRRYIGLVIVIASSVVLLGVLIKKILDTSFDNCIERELNEYLDDEEDYFTDELSIEDLE